MEAQQQPPAPRRSLRRAALTELNESGPEEESQTPRRSSPDEFIIMQRGPRKKPITWSPVDYDKSKILGPPRDVTPEPVVNGGSKPDINPKLRRRLALSPSKGSNAALGVVIAKKLRSLKFKKDDASS